MISTLLFSNLKIGISIQKTILSLKIDILILNTFIWTWNWYLNFEVLNLNFKKLFDFKIENWIPSYYFGLLKLIFQFRKLLMSLKMDILILNIIILI